MNSKDVLKDCLDRCKRLKVSIFICAHELYILTIQPIKEPSGSIAVWLAGIVHLCASDLHYTRLQYATLQNTKLKYTIHYKHFTEYTIEERQREMFFINMFKKITRE